MQHRVILQFILDDELFRQRAAHYIPRKGDLVQFDHTHYKVLNVFWLLDQDRGKDDYERVNLEIQKL